MKKAIKCKYCKKEFTPKHRGIKRVTLYCCHSCSLLGNRTEIEVGLKINMLTYLSNEESKPFINSRGEKSALRFIKCICDCGNITIIRFLSFKKGATKSCGCIRHIGKPKIHGLSRHPLYDVRKNMIARCYDSSNISYINYGGRGVTVCEEWINSLTSFYEWAINNGWEKGLEIDKDIIGNGLLYSPGTCCFVTKIKNANNKRNTIRITIDDKELSIKDICDKYGLSRKIIYTRIKKGITGVDLLKIKIK